MEGPFFNKNIETYIKSLPGETPNSMEFLLIKMTPYICQPGTLKYLFSLVKCYYHTACPFIPDHCLMTKNHTVSELCHGTLMALTLETFSQEQMECVKQ